MHEIKTNPNSSIVTFLLTGLAAVILVGFASGCGPQPLMVDIGSGRPVFHDGPNSSAYSTNQTEVDEQEFPAEFQADVGTFPLEDFARNNRLCTKLPVDGVYWPETLLNRSQLKAFLVALNLTGSFEGTSGWSNLSNNFDGQGLSMGLFNQTLGTGSLQPLLIKSDDRHAIFFSELFAPIREASLRGMLSDWRGSAMFGFTSQQPIEPVSPLDIEYDSQSFFSVGQTPSQRSVDWAVKTLYNGSKFKPEWKSELLALLLRPEYRLIQMEAALNLHQKALNYFVDLKFKTYRAYLFLLDVVVQNGGFWQSDITTFKKKVAQYPKWTETRRLTELLNIRLTHVKSQWRADVKARKTSIINGTGKVHGTTRNYQSEYCFSMSESLDPKNIGKW